MVTNVSIPNGTGEVTTGLASEPGDSLQARVGPGVYFLPLACPQLNVEATTVLWVSGSQLDPMAVVLQLFTCFPFPSVCLPLLVFPGLGEPDSPSLSAFGTLEQAQTWKLSGGL